jgi:hypothetical protein
MITKLILGLLLVVLVLVLSVIYMMRQAGPELAREADRFNIPVIEQAMGKLSSWDYNELSPYLSKSFIELLATDGEIQKDLDIISRLGRVLSYSGPRHVSFKRYDHWLYGECAVNRYTVSTKFEKGKGVVKFKLNHCYEKPKITFLQVVSRSLPSNSPALQ